MSNEEVDDKLCQEESEEERESSPEQVHIDVKDVAQPTKEELNEYENFSSK